MKAFLCFALLAASTLGAPSNPKESEASPADGRDKRSFVHGDLALSGWGPSSYSYGGLDSYHGYSGYSSYSLPAVHSAPTKFVSVKKVVDVPQVVHVNKVVSVPKVVSYSKVVSVPKVVTKLVAAPVEHVSFGHASSGWW